MPTRLTPEVVTDALTALPGWTGNEDRISRTVKLPTEEMAQLKTAVAESANSMDHHPVVEDGEGTTTFVLWTHSEGGVTELDIALAARIDDLVMTVSGVPTEPGGVVHAQDLRNVDVVADEGKSAHPHHDEGQGEPFIGVGSASGGQPATPIPDTAPFEPEPGVDSPEGRQGGGPG